MISKTKKIFSPIILIALALLFIYYLKTNISDFKQLQIVNPVNLIFLIFISITFYFFNGLLLSCLIKPFGINLKIKEWFGLSVITGFYNYITPFRGGAAARAVYLKKKHNFPYVHFLATLSAIYVIIFLIGSLVGILSMFFIWLHYGVFNSLIFFVFLIFSLFLLSIIIFSPKLHESKNKWLNRLIEVINGWHLIKNNKRIIFVTCLISTITILLGSLMFYLEFRIFGINIEFVKALFLASIGRLSLLLNITPGALGIREAIITFSSSVLGVGTVQALSVSLLDRAIFMLILFILGPIFSYILLKYNSSDNKGKDLKNEKTS